MHTYIHTHRPLVQCFVQRPSGPTWPLLEFLMLCSCLTHTQANSCSRAVLPALLAMTWPPATRSYCPSLRFFPAAPLLTQLMSPSPLFEAQYKILWPCSQGMVLSRPRQASGSRHRHRGSSLLHCLVGKPLRWELCPVHFLFPIQTQGGPTDGCWGARAWPEERAGALG